jgi:hypothetical protein
LKPTYISRCPLATINLEWLISAVRQMLTQAYQKELRKFDTQRVTAAWDGLVSKQQAALEALGVPVMYVSDLAADREASIYRSPISLPFLTSLIAVRGCIINPIETAACRPGT